MLKKILLISCCIVLSGCITAYDPFAGGKLIELQVQLEQASCPSKNWEALLQTSKWISYYSNFRADQQEENLKGLHGALLVASNSSSKVFCEDVLKSAKERVEIAKSVWRTR